MAGSSTILIGIYAMGVRVVPLNHMIGANIQLPNYITESTSIISLLNVEYNMCFWGCVALMNGSGRDKYQKAMKNEFKKFYDNKVAIESYKGFDLTTELPKFEENYKYAINVVEYKINEENERSVKFYIRSKYHDREQKYLNIYNNHLSYISKINALQGKHACPKCGYSADKKAYLDRHACSTDTKDYFVDRNKSIWQVKRNEIIELCDYYEVEDEDLYKYDYLVTYDLESILVKTNNVVSDKLTFNTEHKPVSCSIASNIPGYEETICIISTNANELPVKMFEHFTKLQVKAYELMKQKLEKLYSKITDKKDLSKLDEYASSLPIVGFNSSFYDINLLTKYGFMNEIYKRDKDQFIIKAGSRYKVIKTKQFEFLDQMGYCAAGTSLDKFIKAYDIKKLKGIFHMNGLTHTIN